MLSPYMNSVRIVLVLYLLLSLSTYMNFDSGPPALSDDWFAPAEASLKRSVVRKLIDELVTGSYENHPKLACGSEQLDERHQICSNAEEGPTGEFLGQKCSAGEPVTICTARDVTHEIQPSKSICLNDPEEKGLLASGCMLDTGRVPAVDVQSQQEPEVCAPDKDTVVCLSTQDEKNELVLAESNLQLKMRPRAPEDDEAHMGSNCVVANKENGESLFVSLDHSEKVPSQGEVGVQDIMVSTSCSISEIAAQANVCQEHSFQRSADVGDECVGPSEDTGSAMMLDSCKDDDGPIPEKMTAEGDYGDPHEDMDSAVPGDIDKDIAGTECKDSLVYPIIARNATIENVKEDSLVDPIIARNATIENVKEDSLVDPVTAENAIIENVEEISTADPVTVEDAIIENVKNISTTADNVNHGELYVSSQLPEGNADNGMTGDGPELKIGNTPEEENTDKVVAGDCTHESNVNAKDSPELKVGNTDNGTSSGSTFSSNVDEGNTVRLISGDCTNETYVNLDGEDAGKYLATDGAVPCEDDRTWTDGVALSLDAPCSTNNETVSKETSSDGKRPLPDGTCELVDRSCIPNRELSENTSFDGKRPAPDGTFGETDIVVPGVNCVQKDDGQDTDAKIERHYKRRKVLALEKQQSFSGETSLD